MKSPTTPDSRFLEELTRNPLRAPSRLIFGRTSLFVLYHRKKRIHSAVHLKLDPRLIRWVFNKIGRRSGASDPRFARGLTPRSKIESYIPLQYEHLSTYTCIESTKRSQPNNPNTDFLAKLPSAACPTSRSMKHLSS